ncbi:MAG: hypothetical protein HKL96_03630 [Phycisphaerales bacterium]|nr:hypothetical protein [Phycisphaerales bacterium]
MHLPSIPLGVLPFVTPWVFFAGAGALSIPIVIHLLNRRRFRIQRWAAMEFLLAAHRRNARRLKFQRWLLLLLRCLALLLLAAAVAQFTFGSTLLNRMLGSSRRAAIVVWDDAYPMGYAAPGRRSNFARSQRLLAGWLEGLSGDVRVAIMPASQNDASLEPRPTLDHALLRRLVLSKDVTDAAVDLPRALAQALHEVHKLQGRASHIRVIVLTDGARCNFGMTSNAAADSDATARQLARYMAKLRAAGCHVMVADVGRSRQSNLAITQLATLRPIALVDQPLQLSCRVYNASNEPQANVPVSFYLDGVPAGQQIIGRINPGQSQAITALLTQSIHSRGLHVITAKIPPDFLPVDNVRRLVVKAVRHVQMLLVDGDPGDSATQTLAGTAWLAAALAPLRHNNIYKPRVISEVELSTTSLRRYVGVVLSDTPTPDAAQAARLRKFVAGGGTLIIFPGPRTNGPSWTQSLGVAPSGLLAAAMGPVVSARAGTGKHYVNFDLAGSENPITEPFIAAQRGGRHVGLAGVRNTHYVKLAVPTDNASAVVLRFAGGSPAVVLRRIGKGAVVQWAITADTRWSDFAAQPSWLPFIYQILDYALPPSDAYRNVQVGQRLHLPVSQALVNMGVSAVSWFGPPGSNPAITARVGAQGLTWSSPPLWHAGLYGPHMGADVPAVTVNVDPADAEVRHVSARRQAMLLGLPPTDIVENPQSLSLPHARGSAAAGNAGHNLLMAALLALLAEALLARAFSRYRHAEPTGKAGSVPT